MKRRPKSLWGTVPLLALGGSCIAPLADAPAVTPQRPTFSSDTSTTAAGTYELEAGLNVDPNDSFDSPLVFKRGVDERSEVFVGLSPYQEVSVPGPNADGTSDTVIGYRRRFHEREDHAAAWLAAVKLPTGDESDGLSSGELDVYLAAIYSRSVEDLSLVGYYQLEFLGETTGSGFDVAHGLAIAASHPVAPEISAFGEVAYKFGAESPDPLFTTLGATYTVAPGLVLDTAVVLGLNSQAPDVQFVVGFTRNMGRMQRQ